jgi:hypothetical protein
MELTQYGEAYEKMTFGGRFLTDAVDNLLWTQVKDRRALGAIRYLGISILTDQMYLEPYEVSNMVEAGGHWLYGIRALIKDKETEVYILDSGEEVIN